MAKKYLLTLDDLYDFYSTKKKSMSFSAEKSGYNLAVQVPGVFSVKEDKNSEGLLYAEAMAFHDSGNRNHSYIDTEVLEKNLMSMKDRPIMADIIDIEKNGETVKDFSGHTMVLDEEQDKIIYIEKPVGHFINPDSFKLEYSEEYDRNFVHGDCVIYEEYTDACNILRRRGKVDCSVELCIRDLSFNAKTSEMVINDFYIQGCTLLGESVAPGMLGSNVKLKDFSELNNSMFSSLTDEENEKIIEMQKKIAELDAKLSCFNNTTLNEKNDKGKEDDTVRFNELLEQYGKTVEDVTFDYDELSDEELEAKFAEVFGEDNGTGEDNGEDEGVNNTDVAPDNEPINTQNSMVRSYELSHDDIRYALYNLIAGYEEIDNDYYFISAVFDNKFVMESWSGKIYGQKYTTEGDEVKLDGERYELFAEYLTASEKAELENIRSNYSSISEKLAKYEEAEATADKMTVFEDVSYSQYLETEEFKKLMSEESVKSFTKEELQDKADILFAKLTKAKGNFSAENNVVETPKKSPSMFAFAKQDHECSFLDELLKK